MILPEFEQNHQQLKCIYSQIVLQMWPTYTYMKANSSRSCTMDVKVFRLYINGPVCLHYWFFYSHRESHFLMISHLTTSSSNTAQEYFLLFWHLFLPANNKYVTLFFVFVCMCMCVYVCVCVCVFLNKISIHQYSQSI